MRDSFFRIPHVLALGLWFGGATFFNLVAAPAIFESFERVVYTNPSDRTANETIIPADASPERMKNLARALAGSAVGPVFPQLFLMEAVCGAVALFTAVIWMRAEGGRRVHRWRVLVIGVAWITVAAGWAISERVSELRLLRFSPDSNTAAAATDAFASWHLVSLLLSFVTVLLAGVALAMAAKLPPEER